MTSYIIGLGGVMKTSTRRFFADPAFVLTEAIGSVCARPTDSMSFCTPLRLEILHCGISACLRKVPVAAVFPTQYGFPIGVTNDLDHGIWVRLHDLLNGVIEFLLRFLIQTGTRRWGSERLQ